MTKRILAPIGAEERSEAIVPLVAALARESGATVRLLRVFPVPERILATNGRTVAYVDQEMARLTDEGLEELARIETALPGVPVERIVRFGDPEEEILVEAEAFGADLIALTTTTRGRTQRFIAPDVADRVAGSATVPTLVLHG